MGHPQVESQLVFKGPCPACGSSDANANYDDGHTHCFSCGKNVRGEGAPQPTKARKRMAADLVPAGEYRDLKKRGITEETCKKFGYTVGHFRGQVVQIAPYMDEEGTVIRQKLRFPDKEFLFTGSGKPCLFGEHLWSGGKMVVITEGEIDAMSVSQLQGNRWPVVSIYDGANGAMKALSRRLDWLLQFESIILMFDNDKPGREAADECAQLFPHGRCKIAKLPLKDANEMLVAGRGEEVIRAIWNAQAYRPASVLTVDDIYEDALKPIEMGDPWPWKTLTESTFGIQPGRVYTYGAGTGIGKSDVFAQVAMHTRLERDQPVGIISLEQVPTETLNRLAGKFAGRPFHVPDGSWEEEERRAALGSLKEKGGIYFRNQWGADDWEDVVQWIRWLVVSEGVKHIFLDHLTGIAAGSEESESDTLKAAMAGFATLAAEQQFALHMISHLNTPEGKPHEEGGRVMIRHFRGSRAIGYWSHFMFGLERDQQCDDPALRNVTTFRILKDRLSGRGTGVTFGLRYDQDTGLLHECAMGDDNEYGFTDETTNEPPEF